MNHRWRLISREEKFHRDFVPSVTKQLEIFSLLFPTGCSQESLRRCSLSGTLSMFCNFDSCRPDLLTVIELRSWWDSIDVGFYSDGVTIVATFPLLKIPEGLSALEMSGGAPSGETLEKSRPPRALLSCWSVCKQTDGATDCNGLKDWKLRIHPQPHPHPKQRNPGKVKAAQGSLSRADLQQIATDWK